MCLALLRLRKAEEFDQLHTPVRMLVDNYRNKCSNCVSFSYRKVNFIKHANQQQRVINVDKKQ